MTTWRMRSASFGAAPPPRHPARPPDEAGAPRALYPHRTVCAVWRLPFRSPPASSWRSPDMQSLKEEHLYLEAGLVQSPPFKDLFINLTVSRHRPATLPDATGDALSRREGRESRVSDRATLIKVSFAGQGGRNGRRSATFAGFLHCSPSTGCRVPAADPLRAPGAPRAPLPMPPD